MCCLSITGCQLKCKGCHSKELWNKKNGTEIDDSFYELLFKKYQNHIDGICFLGGEWDESFINHIKKVKDMGNKQKLKNLFIPINM